MITPTRTPQKNFIFKPHLRSITAVLAVCVLGSCTVKTHNAASGKKSASAPSADLSAEAGTLFPASPNQNATSPTRDDSWTIVLARPAGDDMAGMQALNQARSHAALSEARLEKRGRSLVVAIGRYSSPADPKAREDLERVRAISHGSGKPYEGAVLAPPALGAVEGSDPEMNLATLKARQGKRAVYTLQVAAYERADGKEATPEDLATIRQAAERAAAAMRKDGEEAFYYHGPRRSMVTVGVFGEREADSGTGRLSPALRALQARHPNNLVNGAPLIVKNRANPKGIVQPSFVVAVPD